jgi:galactokinase
MSEMLEDEAVSPQDYQTRLAFLERALQRCRARYADTDPEALRLIEHHFSNFRKNELAPALARWHAQHTTLEQATTTDERPAKSTATVAEIQHVLQEAHHIVVEVRRGLQVQEQRLHMTLGTLRNVLENSNNQLADDIIRNVALATDRLFQVISHLDEGREAFNVAMQQYGRHPL